MLKKTSIEKQRSIDNLEKPLNDNIEFSWHDILAMIIAVFQVLFPYVIVLFLAYLGVMVIFTFWFA